MKANLCAASAAELAERGRTPRGSPAASYRIWTALEPVPMVARFVFLFSRTSQDRFQVDENVRRLRTPTIEALAQEESCRFPSVERQ